ncbi:MAG TPA: NAAT family transporter [Methanocorpusculum sp.]|nr:MarC family protein [Candidatus Methanocorpusculum faecipullorum]HJK08161.1 NAAT family transporter [Methanocorpusculum sp.]HJK11885.1 NAAT family transporter [Methanocorpusculum sp.]HJK12143.1 NAAT family transporter [Methanocorpusculum sp.]HJK16045.1 NAAT family transporter [Methanocorpusculum sp.]
MLEILTAIVSSAITLFIILDPLLSTSMFIDLTRGLSGKEVLKQAGIATSVAGVLMLVFLVFNDVIFSILNIELDSFKVAGGIILFILGLQIVLGLEIGGKAAHEARAEQARDGAELLPGTVRKSMAGVIIGTPIMCGPGTITTVMIIGSEYGILITAVAIILALLVIWMILAFSSRITAVLGETVIVILSKIVGLLLTAIAVHTIWSGVVGLIGLTVAGL